MIFMNENRDATYRMSFVALLPLLQPAFELLGFRRLLRSLGLKPLGLGLQLLDLDLELDTGFTQILEVGVFAAL